MSDLTTLHGHAREMAGAQHTKACSGTTEDRWGLKTVWPDPECQGCITDAERNLWTQIADEIEAYLAPESGSDLFGELA